MAGEEDDDKQYAPSQKKLDDARAKGEFPRSTDLTTAAAYGGFLLAGAAVGASGLSVAAAILSGLLARADSAADRLFAGSGRPLAGGLMIDLAVPLGPFFLLPAVLAIASIGAQRGFAFTPDKLAFKLSRISPLSNAKNKFGRAGLFEFAKSFTKLSVYGVVLGAFLLAKMPEIMTTLALPPGMVTLQLLGLSMNFLFIVLAIATVIGGVDYLFQQADHQRKNRMSRKEMTDEHKEAEGDPQFKQHRRQKGFDIAMRQMLADVPGADVVIVNPSHYAVALRWQRGTDGAPVCLAKGVDEIAARIRELANEHGVPIHRDPPTARALHSSIEVGAEIWPEHYPAVAAAIRFAELMRARARTGYGRGRAR